MWLLIAIAFDGTKEKMETRCVFFRGRCEGARVHKRSMVVGKDCRRCRDERKAVAGKDSER
jgi:hypothetical protein